MHSGDRVPDMTKSGEKAEQLPQHTNSASRPSKREPAKKATVVQSKKKPPAAKYPPPSTKKNEKAQRAKGREVVGLAVARDAPIKLSLEVFASGTINACLWLSLKGNVHQPD